MFNSPFFQQASANPFAQGWGATPQVSPFGQQPGASPFSGIGAGQFAPQQGQAGQFGQQGQHPLAQLAGLNPAILSLLAAQMSYATPQHLNPLLGQGAQFGGINPLYAQSNPFSSFQQAGQFGQQSGQYGQQASPFGQQPGQYGQQASPFGQQPGQYGQQASPFGQQSGQYGQPGQLSQLGQPNAGISPQGAPSPYGALGAAANPWLSQQYNPQINPLIAAQLAAVNPLAQLTGQFANPLASQFGASELNPYSAMTGGIGGASQAFAGVQNPFVAAQLQGLPQAINPFGGSQYQQSQLGQQQQQRLPIRPLINPQQFDPSQINSLSQLTGQGSGAGLTGGQSIDPYALLAQSTMMSPYAANPLQQMARPYQAAPWLNSPVGINPALSNQSPGWGI
jgi:hypothetical protein